LKYVATICGLLANTLYLLYLLIIWLFVRVIRRLKAYTRQQRLMYEVRRDNLLLKIQ
jgi:1,4-dihydroxy-2-naphthoate octaprenyltransferase